MHTNDILKIKEIFGLLWTRYDSGGLSLGRSKASQLLEAAMNLPLYDTSIDFAKISTGKNIRPVKKYPNQDLLFSSPKDISSFTDEALTYILFCKLNALVHDTQYRETGPFDIEIETFKKVFPFFKRYFKENHVLFENCSKSFSHIELVTEAETRRSVQFEYLTWVQLHEE